MQDLRQTQQNVIAGNMVLDIDPLTIKGETITYARNSDAQNPLSPTFRSIEPSNYPCVTAPYPINGAIELPDGTFLMSSTDDTNSELGIMDHTTCTYTTIVNNTCLNLSTKSPVTGRSKTLPNGDVIVYMRDDINPPRRINLSKIPYTYTIDDNNCKTKQYTNELSCEEIQLFKSITIPCATYTKSQGGNLDNGVYSILMAYSANSQRFSDYYPLTLPIQMNTEFTSGSITLNIQNLDREFDTYQVYVIGDVNGHRAAKLVGEYYTSQTTVTISDYDTLSIINLSEIPISKPVYEKAGIMSGNQQLLILGDLTTRKPLNYQLQAFGIRSRYIVRQEPLDYYQTGDDIGYYRNERYRFFIDWLYTTGEYSQESQIPGRPATSDDLSTVSGPDVYEPSLPNPPEETQRWQVENTAQPMVLTQGSYPLIGEGEMGYWQSTDLYPDNGQFGENACTPIRDHLFPDECKVPRYSNINGKLFINILGIQFTNIPHPLDEDGQPVKGIKGYRIIRQDRNGDRSIVARGIATNVRSYTDEQNEKTILYSNYPYNSLQPDPFLSSTQTVFKGKSEKNYTPLETFSNSQFTFYSPHTFFPLKYRLGNEVIFETEEVATVTGNFEPVHKHPRFKLLTQTAFWSALAFALIETTFEATGQKGQTNTTTTDSGSAGLNVQVAGDFTVTPIGSSIVFGPSTQNGTLGVSHQSSSQTQNSALSIASGAVGNALKSIQGLIKGGVSNIKDVIKAFKSVVSLIASFGASAVLFTLQSLSIANQLIGVIRDFLDYVNYAYQYNSVADFNQSICITEGNKRRYATRKPYYLPSTIVTIDNQTFNNYGKQEGVFLQLNKDVKPPRTEDTSSQTISMVGTCDDPQREFTSTASAFYVTIRQNNPNQYGVIQDIKPVAIHACPIQIDTTQDVYTSPILYGGDCIIAPFSVITKQPLFSQDLADTDIPDGTPYDYRLYRNIGYARYWLDSSKYDYSAFLNSNVVNYSKFSRTTTAKYNLDCKFNDKGNVFRVDSSYFYTSVNGVMNFVAESDYNISYREETDVPHYSERNTDLKTIHRADNLKKREEFRLNESYKHLQLREVSHKVPNYVDNIPQHLQNSVVYSLPSFQSQQTVDNWQYFLPTNFYTFEQTDFGILTGIHKLDQDRVIFLFSRSSPYISMGQSQLQVSNQTVTIGDGGLFAQQPRELLPTNVKYAASQSPYAFTSTQFGYAYPSQSQGRLFNFTSNLEDVTRNGFTSWAETYMPIQLYKRFPNYKERENPLTRVGYLMVADSKRERYYITKRDFLPLLPTITYNPTTQQFYNEQTPVELHNPLYFKDISFTYSYSPTSKGLVSFHDWKPDWVIQLENHFMTIKGDTVYMHNDTCTSFANFYGVQYPYEIEFGLSTGQQPHIASSIELIVNPTVYRNDCRDSTETEDFFSNLEVYNNDQHSGKLNLIPATEARVESQTYPIFRSSSVDTLYTRTEQRYRMNQWSDITSNHTKDYHHFVNSQDGYTRQINPVSISYTKPEEERKRLRSTFTRFRLTKQAPSSTNLLTKLSQIKHSPSIR